MNARRLYWKGESMRSVLGVLLALFSLNVYAHGEDKHGPNGGYIRMPANFHTEVVKLNDKKIQVYLLDIQFKNPTTANSDVSASHYIGHSENKMNCRPKKKKYFECLSKTELKEGHLKITARRNDKTNYDAFYPLPLRLEANSNTGATSEPNSKDKSKNSDSHHHHH